MNSYNSTTQQQAQRIDGSFTVSEVEAPPVLELRADSQAEITHNNEGSANGSHVRWQQEVVDNENMNKKKTKICCIYHPQDPDQEEEHHHSSSDSDSSSSSSSSESDNEGGYNFAERRQRRIARRHRKLQDANRKIKPNAYEVQPDYSNNRQRTTQN